MAELLQIMISQLGNFAPSCDIRKAVPFMNMISNSSIIPEKSAGILADTHVHTEFSGDSSTPVRSQIEQALSLGMRELCITDHHDLDAPSDIDFTLDLDQYVSAIQALKAQYQDRIALQLGIELGLQLHLAPKLKKITASYPFDYVIGSNHFVDRMDPYFPAYFEGKTEEEGYRRYFESTLERIQSIPDFDVLGHLDYVVRYGPNQNKEYSYSKYKEFIDPILKNLVETGRGLECNTGGYKYGLGHPNPTEEILARYLELGGEIITIGSDAHDPVYLAFDFARAKEVLTGLGFRYYAVYCQRRPHFYSL